jgi:EAL domain-containing protein (putative c-di-GMP-specific phosphodiesterase class I)
MNAPLAPNRPLGTSSCGRCAEHAPLGFDFSMAFQPMWDAEHGCIFAHEALVRGIDGAPAAKIFERVDETNRYRFDQACRVKAVELASRLKMRTHLSINFMPNAVYQPELCIRTTLQAAQTYAFPVDRIIFEITEGEKVEDVNHLRNIVEHYRKQGFLTAIDDFGAGYSGLNLLAELRTDLVKLDMALIRGIDADKGRQVIARGIVQVCTQLGMRIIAEGIETSAEYAALRDMGVQLFQGYYFARPAFEALAEVRREAIGTGCAS